MNKLKQKNSKIFLYRGAELPEGWLGKNWACYQLSKLARKNLLLFVDADVRIGENSIYSAVQIMKETSTDLLSVFPSQITASAGERLIVPLMHWLLLTFLPLIQVYKSSKSSIAAANGQFILIKRKVYAAIGTHEEFKDRIVEDMEIVRCAKRKKFSVITCLGDGRITAKMYGSFKEAFQGFIKNFYPGFNISRFNFSIILSVYLVLFLFPYISVFWSLKNIYLIIAIIFERIFVSFLSKENIMFNVIFHPLQILIMFLIGLTSVLRKRKKWKGRLI